MQYNSLVKIVHLYMYIQIKLWVPTRGQISIHFQSELFSEEIFHSFSVKKKKKK